MACKAIAKSVAYGALADMYGNHAAEAGGSINIQGETQKKLDVVSNETAAILSLLRRYQALAQVQAAESRLLATLGLEPEIGSTGTLSLKELTEQVRGSPAAWQQMMNKATVPTTEPRASAPATSAPASAAAPLGELPPALAQYDQQTRGQW